MIFILLLMAKCAEEETMFIRSVYQQVRLLISKWTCLFTFGLLLLIILVNYKQNIIEYQGYDVLWMYREYAKMSVNSAYGN